MTLKDKLPDRLKCSPLLTMESDSDIETIAESIVNLSDSDGDFFKKTEKLLLMAALGYLRDWCEPSQRTIGTLGRNRRYRRSRKSLCPECGYGTRRERKGIRRGVRRAVEGRAF